MAYDLEQEWLSRRSRAVIAWTMTALAVLAPVGQSASRPDDGLTTGRLVPQGAQAEILRAFRSHRIVLLGEVHRSSEMHCFLRSLVASPEFPRIVNDVVLEALNVRYQPMLDRYAAGDSVSRDSLRLAWRNTTQLLVWDSPVYEELLETVRSVNAGLPAGRKLRILASDPPVDWATVRSPADFPKSFGYRDWQATEVLEREVLSRGRRALVVIGNTHVRRAGPKADSLPTPPEREGVGQAFARKHPGVAYSIETVIGGSGGELPRLLSLRAPPNTLVPIAGTSLGKLNSTLLFGDVTLFRVVDGKRVPVKVDPSRMPPLSDIIDAFLYLGPYSHEISPDPELYKQDADYLAEIRRRIEILSKVYGGDFWTSDLEALLRCAGP